VYLNIYLHLTNTAGPKNRELTAKEATEPTACEHDKSGVILCVCLYRHYVNHYYWGPCPGQQRAIVILQLLLLLPEYQPCSYNRTVKMYGPTS